MRTPNSMRGSVTEATVSSPGQSRALRNANTKPTNTTPAPERCAATRLSAKKITITPTTPKARPNQNFAFPCIPPPAVPIIVQLQASTGSRCMPSMRLIPVVTDTDIHYQWHLQFGSTLHQATDLGTCRLDLECVHLEHQFIVHLHQHAYIRLA